jgi:hypothetical protein
MTIEAFVKNYSNAPPIAASIIQLPSDDLRGHILAGADYRPCKSSIAVSVTPV